MEMQQLTMRVFALAAVIKNGASDVAIDGSGERRNEQRQRPSNGGKEEIHLRDSADGISRATEPNDP